MILGGLTGGGMTISGIGKQPERGKVEHHNVENIIPQSHPHLAPKHHPQQQQGNSKEE